MDTLSYKTVSANTATVDKNWVLIDAQNEPLGRLASKIASLIRGKHKTNFTPHVDCGDNVVVINASKIKLTGNKWEDKKYITYSGYPGGQKVATAAEVMAKHPTRMVEKAVKGMLPNGKLGRAMYRNLFVYEGAEHKQEAQQPKEIKVSDLK
ncbi:MAG: 50S ribosomal protein L13 [Flavobacteriales bacterium]|nr:MAG: 50S ribosomal protein L13 [Flavobacteriales bacterium]